MTGHIDRIVDSFIGKNQSEVGMLRLDKIHPILSGNKYFKLKYYLEDAINNKKDTVVSFGGYYSNHLHATAYACKQAGLHSIGYIRGTEPPVLNDTLKDCIKFGMELKFVPTTAFEHTQHEWILRTTENFQCIPMGGNGLLGIQGASEILRFETAKTYDYIIASAGTGTTAAGLLQKLNPHQQLILMSAVKNNFSLIDEIINLESSLSTKKNQLSVFWDFHCGGFGKSNEELIHHMNWFYKEHRIETDFVYTGKMMLGFYELLKRGYFPKESKILIIHSGGLQGNRSLRSGSLIF